MARPYTLKKRAEQQAQTRLRIVEATVDLHGTVGPAATTMSMIAERAGVQRHTLYAHFPDERSLQHACSALALERDPLPAAAAWAHVEEPRERLRRGLGELYGWYARNAGLAACVLRDAEHHALTRETAELRFGPVMASVERVLGAGLTPRQRALLAVAMDFHCWRALDRATSSPVDVIVDAILATGSPASARAQARTRHASRRPSPTASRRA